MKSLRDLTAEHLPLLRNILQEGKVSAGGHSELLQLPASALAPALAAWFGKALLSAWTPTAERWSYPPPELLPFIPLQYKPYFNRGHCLIGGGDFPPCIASYGMSCLGRMLPCFCSAALLCCVIVRCGDASRCSTRPCEELRGESGAG